MSNCLGVSDLRQIDRSSFTLSTRLPTMPEEQVHDPFIRTQSLFRKNTSREIRDYKPTLLFDMSSEAQLEQQTILVEKAIIRQSAVYQKLLEQKQVVGVGEVSFFDSFGKAIEDKGKRIQTEPNEPAVYNKKNQHAKSIFIMGEEEKERTQFKPVTEFFLNLNIQPEEETRKPSPLKISKTMNLKIPESLDFKNVIRRLNKAMQGAEPGVLKEVCCRFPAHITADLNRIAQQIEHTQKNNNENSRPSGPANNRIVKQRDFFDNNRRVHIEMVKVEHKSPELKDTYRKPKEKKSVGKGLYALKSKYNLK